MKPCADKQCRRLGQLLRLSEFPRNQRAKDGRHYYCLECARRQVNESRAKARAMKLAKGELGIKHRRKRIRLRRDPLVEVYRAIEKGKSTRPQIQRSTHLRYDVIGDMLVLLVWEYRAVRIQGREFVLTYPEVLKAA